MLISVNPLPFQIFPWFAIYVSVELESPIGIHRRVGLIQLENLEEDLDLDLELKQIIINSSKLSIKQIPIITTLIQPDFIKSLNQINIVKLTSIDHISESNHSKDFINTLEHSILNQHYQIQSANQLINQNLTNYHHSFKFKSLDFNNSPNQSTSTLLHHQRIKTLADLHSNQLLNSNSPNLNHDLNHNQTKSKPSDETIKSFYNNLINNLSPIETNLNLSPTQSLKAKLKGFETPTSLNQFNKQQSESPDPLALPSSKNMKNKNKNSLELDQKTPSSNKKRKIMNSIDNQLINHQQQPDSSSPIHSNKQNYLIQIDTPIKDNTNNKFINFLQDILEADDMIDINNINTEYFKKITIINPNTLILKLHIIEKLNKYLNQFMNENNQNHLNEIPFEDLIRLIHILERSLKILNEFIMIFPNQNDSFKQKKKNQIGKKNKKGNRGVNVHSDPLSSSKRSTKKTKIDNDIEEIEEGTEETINENNDFVESINQLLLSFESLNFLLTLIIEFNKNNNSQQENYYSNKKIYNEDSLNLLVKGLQFQLTSFINPLLQTYEIIPNNLKSILSLLSNSILPKLNKLLLKQAINVNESIIIILISLSLGPFYTNQKNVDELIYIRIECLKLLKNISVKYPDQKDYIIDEILTSIPKLSENSNKFQLLNGKSIQMISALFLYTLQSNNINHYQNNNDNQSISNDNQIKLNEQEKNDHENIITDLNKLGKKIILYLIQKSGKTKKSLNNQILYKSLFENFMKDLINCLFLKDWPISEFLLNLSSKVMMNILDDNNKLNSSIVDINSIKSICIDQLGIISSRLFKFNNHSSNFEKLLSFKTLIKKEDKISLVKLFNMQREFLINLNNNNNTNEEDDDNVKNAINFLRAQWTVELSKTIQALKQPTQEDTTTNDDFINFLDEQLNVFYNHSTSNTMISNTNFDSMVSMEWISEVQGIKCIGDLILDRIILISASSVVSFRSKAIKALGLVIAEDETIFDRVSVRTAIEHRMLDSSPAVRDSVMELVGKYVTLRPTLAISFLPQISARIADKGLSVRKRVIKLLKSIYLILGLNQLNLKVEICLRLISRIYDEDEGMKDLAMDALTEIWFDHPQNVELENVGDVMVKLFPHSRESTCVALEDVLKVIIKRANRRGESQLKAILTACQSILEHLVDELMEAGTRARDRCVSEVDCLKTIHAITCVSPRMLSPSRAVDLLPFLKSTTTAEEQIVVQVLLKLLKACATDAPRSAKGFAEALQSALLPLLNKPNLAAGGLILQELVSCLCAVVVHQTHDYQILVNVFKACEGKLRAELDSPGSGELRSVTSVLMYIVSTVTGYGQLDELSVANQEIRKELKELSPRPLYMHVYQLIMGIFYNSRALSIRHVTITCLGFLYQSYPTLMTEKQSTEMMDHIFDDCRPELQYRLLKIIADFLTSQTKKAGEADEKEMPTMVDMDQLIGNTDNFADSGVGLAIVQRYLSQITTFAQSTDGPMQKPAVDIIAFTIKQGLAHPITCVPVLVALESAPEPSLASRVFGLHTLLHTKRPELVHTRFLETVKQVYTFHTRPGPRFSMAVSGHVGIPARSVLASWYTLLCQKRIWRLDLLRSLIKAFAADPVGMDVMGGGPEPVAFSRYLAGALATLEFKTQEEVLTVVTGLGAIVGQYAFQTLEILEVDGMDSDAKGRALKASIVLGIGLVLRDRLKSLYGLSDAKCAKFLDLGGKKSKVGDSATIRKDEIQERGWDDELLNRVPGLKEEVKDEEQIEGFRELVRLDVVLKVHEDDEDEKIPEVEEEEEGCGSD
ncbi:hypothetical protein CROQUDRAFT_108552 [Cronartium quercuum f. sp. fusiforme G11]|uniref:Sister chromatid cohesion protein n=1 Tax=Cronartium quercuum f. sp. fusiforme G11 TaxID=708437 RepID=A0A9P6TAA2_9BASI|nr:hypothetical protein CROQUDRAFT_108552 [Cronartium quercuum f. sp. fusiforme G11]